MKSGPWAAACLAIVVAWASGAAAQSVRAGVEAWQHSDFAVAVQQWRGPAAAGDADAQFDLGQAYKLGRGVTADPAQAQDWFRKAAEQGHAQGQTNYALALLSAGRKQEAASWLEKAAANGEPRGEFVLGRLLFDGDGVPRDMPRAFALTTLAARAGVKPAAETLAQMDRYISPAERAAGTRLVQRYAAATPSPTPHGRVRASQDVPPPQPLARPTPAARLIPAAKPAPADTRTTPDRPRNPAVAGRWRAQLGAFRDRANAEALWARVRPHMATAQPSYLPAGNLTRLVVRGFPSRADAQQACARAGMSCILLAP